jgi:hypothetical protein
MHMWGGTGGLESSERTNRHKENIQLFGRPSPLVPAISSLPVQRCRRQVSLNHVVNTYKATRRNVPENVFFSVCVI